MRKTVTKLMAKRRMRRRAHVRHKVVGSSGRPRLSVYRSLNHIYVQVVDDSAGHTLCSASSRDSGVVEGGTGNVDAAQAVGRRIAEKAKEAGIAKVVFDRNGFKYHGRVKALADAAREGGLEF